MSQAHQIIAEELTDDGRRLPLPNQLGVKLEPKAPRIKGGEGKSDADMQQDAQLALAAFVFIVCPIIIVIAVYCIYQAFNH